MDWKTFLKPTINKVSFTLILFLVSTVLRLDYDILYWVTNVLNFCPGYQDIAMGDCIFGLDFLRNVEFYVVLLILSLYFLSSVIFHTYGKLKQKKL